MNDELIPIQIGPRCFPQTPDMGAIVQILSENKKFVICIGHSEAIAEQHSSKANYRGTLYYPLAELDKNARLIIKHLIRSKTLGTCLKLGSRNLHFKEAVSVLHDYAGHSESFKKAVCCIEHLFPKTF